jgi:hypothetical protein
MTMIIQQQGPGFTSRRDRPRQGRGLLVALAAGALLASTACQAPDGPGISGDGRPLFADMEAFTGLPAQPRAGASETFWEWWGDGRAELSGYRMRVTRYGAPREAELALIYVTEPHDRRTWIKDDDVGAPHRVEVLKLNQMVEFLTGIYPYSVMTSTFAPVEPFGDERFQPVRIVHQVQEWCGAYSRLIWPGPERFRSLRLSYFAHGGERIREVDAPPGTLYEDALLVQLRELDGPFAGGGDWEGMLVPELWRLRTGHRGTDPVPATIRRGDAERTLAGGETVPVTRFTLEAEGTSGTYLRVFDVERGAPRRVLAWTTSTGEEAELLATERLPYWELNRPGDESYREALGLSPRGSLPPATGDAPAGGCPE